MLKKVSKLIVILGPTASGKSELAVKIAEKFNGEIISADSRQIYKGMDIGTGKMTPDTKNSSNSRAAAKGGEEDLSSSTFSTRQAKKKYIFTHKRIPHYCIDVASPKKRFTVVQYRKLTLKAIDEILKKGKIPILCGGTGFYIQAVVDGIVIPEVKPDRKLREKLEKKTTEELFNRLKKLDPKRAKTIDKKNRRRLIRALEIVIKTKKPVPALKKNPLAYPVLILGIKKEKAELKNLIKKRLLRRLKKQGMIEEIKNLRQSGISWQRLEEFGLEYRFVAQYLQKKINYSEMINLLQKEIEHFAKRQMTWFKRDKRINWIKNENQVKKLVKKFLK